MPRPARLAYGQESNHTTWRLAKMNLAIRGIESSQVKRGEASPLAPALRSSATPLNGGSAPVTPPPFPRGKRMRRV
ncbi:MAG: SAM-dependent methyltransferase [Treponema sp.]|nr:SAM-dependent methyltransferase [Treponema sp.]